MTLPADVQDLLAALHSGAAFAIPPATAARYGEDWRKQHLGLIGEPVEPEATAAA